MDAIGGVLQNVLRLRDEYKAACATRQAAEKHEKELFEKLDGFSKRPELFGLSVKGTRRRMVRLPDGRVVDVEVSLPSFGSSGGTVTIEVVELEDLAAGSEAWSWAATRDTRAWEGPFHSRAEAIAYGQARGGGWIAEGLRGESEPLPSEKVALACAQCNEGRPAACLGRYEGEVYFEPACSTCCGHGNEDGRCVSLAVEG